MKLSRLKEEVKIKYYVLKKRNKKEYYINYQQTSNVLDYAKKFNTYIEAMHKKIIDELSEYEIVSIK